MTGKMKLELKGSASRIPTRKLPLNDEGERKNEITLKLPNLFME